MDDYFLFVPLSMKATIQIEKRSKNNEIVNILLTEIKLKFSIYLIKSELSVGSPNDCKMSNMQEMSKIVISNLKNKTPTKLVEKIIKQLFKLKNDFQFYHQKKKKI